jgi:hypothetical protein
MRFEAVAVNISSRRPALICEIKPISEPDLCKIKPISEPD